MLTIRLYYLLSDYKVHNAVIAEFFLKAPTQKIISVHLTLQKEPKCMVGVCFVDSGNSEDKRQSVLIITFSSGFSGDGTFSSVKIFSQVSG